jgi:hypothetical protein
VVWDGDLRRRSREGAPGAAREGGRRPLEDKAPLANIPMLKCLPNVLIDLPVGVQVDRLDVFPDLCKGSF